MKEFFRGQCTTGGTLQSLAEFLLIDHSGVASNEIEENSEFSEVASQTGKLNVENTTNILRKFSTRFVTNQLTSNQCLKCFFVSRNNLENLSSSTRSDEMIN